MRLSRREWLAGTLTALATARPAHADAPAEGAPDLDVRDIAVDGDLARRFTLAVPNYLAKDERVPLVILLHGLGETVSERVGAYAWLDRYGLSSSYARLRRPPVARTSRRRDITDRQLAEVNADLASKPFRGFVIACPYTPYVFRQAKPDAALDAYARWIAEVVIPRARSEAPVVPDAAHTSIDGCSLGGHIGLEVFLRRPELFASWGGIQSAIGEAEAPSYAARIAEALAKAGPRALHIETSEGDPFRPGNDALSLRLGDYGIAHDRLVLPGPHDQPFLRESGTLAMLLWHDRN